jgi:hypothetical protein
MILTKLFAKVSDEALTKVGSRYNLFCMVFLLPYATGALFVVIARAVGWPIWHGWNDFVQIAWVLLWLPNLMLIGVRAHRDYDAIHKRHSAFLAKMNEADVEFRKFHDARMAWVRGEPDDEPPKPLVN